MKGTTTKTSKRKVSKSTSEKPAKRLKTHTFSESELMDLKEKMGVSSLSDSIANMAGSF